MWGLERYNQGFGVHCHDQYVLFLFSHSKEAIMAELGEPTEPTSSVVTALRAVCEPPLVDH